MAAVMVAALVAAAIAFAAAVQVDRSEAARTGDPTSPPAAVPAEDGMPTRVAIPAIGVDAPIVPVGLRPDNTMQTPDFGLAGWYQPGPKPGQPGPAVVVAHVDSKANGPDVFFRLRELNPDDQIIVHYPGGTRTFAVTATEQAAKTRLPAERIWNSTTAAVLRLITCGGAFDRTAGSYLDNVIVYADHLVR